MVPRDVVFVNELPKTSTAKVSRRLLREMPAGGPAPTDEQRVRSPVA